MEQLSVTGFISTGNQFIYTTTIFVLARPLMAGVVGAVLAASGLIYQVMFRNPLVSPDILGVSNGASLGAAIGLVLGFTTAFQHHAIAFGFGFGAVCIIMILSKAIGRANRKILVLVLLGRAMTSLFNSVLSVIKASMMGRDQLGDLTHWLTGSIMRNYKLSHMLIVFVIAGVPLLLVRNKINVLSFGEEEAKAMGVNAPLLRLILILCTTLLTATAVSYCGPIGWVGLVVPHICRFVVGPNCRFLLPAVMLAGAEFLMIVDTIAHVAFYPGIPVGILTAIFGVPLFIYILFKRRRDLI